MQKIPVTTPTSPTHYEWGRWRTVCDRFGIGKTKLLEIRTDWWTEGFEFIRETDTSISYNLTLISHWWVHRHEPQLHQKAREAYAARLKAMRETA